MKCENCDNEYTKIDNLKRSNKASFKDLSEYYDVTKPVETCKCCNSKVYPEEIINVKEYQIVGEIKPLNNSNPLLYFDSKHKIIPTNTMKLVGITLEGENENGKREAITLDLSEENFKKLYSRGKELWNKGLVSKYQICLTEKGKCFSYARPDKNNFEKYYRLYEYMDIDYLPLARFKVSEPINKYLDSLYIDEKLSTIPIQERSCDYEIS